MPCVIRVARRGDAEAMYEIHRRAVQRLGREHYADEQVNAMLAGKSPEGYLPAIDQGQMFVAELGGAVVGFGHAEVGEVAGVFVEPGVAGQGVGSSLLRRGVELAQGPHSGPVRVTATLNAVGFYKAHGFVEMGCSEVRIQGVAIPVVAMEMSGEDLEEFNGRAH